MSAFMCSNNHINAIVTYAFANDVCVYFDGRSINAHDKPQEWVNILTECNHRSLVARYDEEGDPPLYKFERHRISATDAEVAKLCHSFNYQACEQEDYELTRGYRAIHAVLDHLLRGLKGYEDAAWAI